MQTNRSYSLLRSPSRALLGAALTLYACSFQDLDYLQDGSGTEGGKAGSGGGQGETGGRDPSGGAGTGGIGMSGGNSPGGAAGAGADGGFGGDGGTTGDGGNGPNGGGGADGGASTAGSAGEGGGGAGGASGGGVATGGVGGSAGADGPGGAGGSGGDPPIVGNQLKNPSFESGLVSWTVDPASAVANRYVYTQPPSSGSVAVDGATVLATWHLTAEYELSVFQTVSGLPDGNYTFKANFASTQSRGAHMFARNCGGTDIELTIPTITDQWFAQSIPAIPVTGGSCEVGFFVHGIGGDWLNADMFTFEKDP